MPLDSEGFRGGAPANRVRDVNRQKVNPHGRFVLYWMIAFRRPRSNFALDRAAAWAAELKRPLVVLESLRITYPYASARLHRFVLDGMGDNVAAFAGTPVTYHPYVEPEPGASAGMMARWCEEAAVVVTDDYPGFFLPGVVSAAGRDCRVLLEAIDSNGLVPLASVPLAYPAAVHFRRHVQSALRTHLLDEPVAAPELQQLPCLEGGLPQALLRWRAAEPGVLKKGATLDGLPLDTAVSPVCTTGGPAEGAAVLRRFVSRRLERYADLHSHPDDDGTSRLSPYLHFGHVSAHEVFRSVMTHEGWNLGRLAGRASGAREGWWGVSPAAEAFLDQLVVWRELGFNTCYRRPEDYSRFEGLPPWAKATLQLHASDPRPYVYDHGEFERGETHDRLWNAAQRQMLREGWMHNYLRMLWGKKILEWSPSPQDALETMTSLMNRWCLDGRDPNSYAGYMWTLGRYDRPWPERPIYGTVRSMSSESAARKVRVARLLGETEQRPLFEG